MDSTYLGWRALARRQWPLVVALLAFLALEQVGSPAGTVARLWMLPGSVVVAVLAVLAPRRPFDAALGAATAILTATVLLRVLAVQPTRDMVSGLSATESAAVMALIATAVRQATPTRGALATTALVAAGTVAEAVRPAWWDTAPPAEHPNPLGTLAYAAMLLVISVGTGLYFRARDRERARATEAEVAAAQQAERLALARELHDVVAHYVTGIVVHAQAAQAVAANNPAAAHEVLPVIATSGSEALAAMRRLVGTLRGADPAGATPAGSGPDLADDVRRVVDRARAAGLPARLTVDLPDPVPPELARSVLRLVQESLTNAGKHASQVSAVDVEVSGSDGELRVRVADDGIAGQDPVGGSGGYGLVGMRERVELLGGRFDAGPAAPRGWQVLATLPVREG